MMTFQDLSSTPEIISVDSPGRYVHVGELVTEIKEAAKKAREMGDTPEERERAQYAAVGMETLATMIALTSTTATRRA